MAIRRLVKSVKKLVANPRYAKTVQRAARLAAHVARASRRGTRTRQKRKTFEPNILIGNGPVAVTTFKKKWKKRKVPRMYKSLTNSSTIESLVTAGQKSSHSTQAYSEFPMYRGSDIIEMAEQAVKLYNATTSSIVAPDFTTTGYMSTKILLQTLTKEWRFTNQGPATVEMDLYVVSAKSTNSTSITPFGSWTAGWTQEKQDAGAGINPVVTPYARPTTVKLFNLDWKIQKKYHVSLESGREWLFRYSFSPNALVDTAYCTNNVIKGITHYILMVQRGTVGDDNNGHTIGNVTIAPTKIVWSERQLSKVSVLSSNPRNYDLNVTLPVPVDNKLFQINDETDAPINTLLTTNFA